MNLQDAANEALMCQDACNLSGVLASFHAVVSDVIWPEARRLGKGTAWVNGHPIVALFLSKLADLNGPLANDFSRAYNAVQAIARGEQPDLFGYSDPPVTTTAQ